MLTLLQLVGSDSNSRAPIRGTRSREEFPRCTLSDTPKFRPPRRDSHDDYDMRFDHPGGPSRNVPVLFGDQVLRERYGRLTASSQSQHRQRSDS